MKFRNTVYSINHRFYQAEEIINSKIGHLKITSQRRRKGMKRSGENLCELEDNTSSKTMYELEGSQEEKIERKLI